MGIVNNVGAVAADEAIRIGTYTARQQIVAKSTGQRIVTIIACDRVVTEGTGTRNQVVDRPYRAIGKFDLFDRAITQGVLYPDTVGRSAEGQHKGRPVRALRHL